jgi:hypothetical protein
MLVCFQYRLETFEAAEFKSTRIEAGRVYRLESQCVEKWEGKNLSRWYVAGFLNADSDILTITLGATRSVAECMNECCERTKLKSSLYMKFE